MEKSWGYAMKRVAAGAHLPIPGLFEPAKRPDDRADYYLANGLFTEACLSDKDDIREDT